MAFFSQLQEQYTQLWKAIARPPRDEYDAQDLGPCVFSMHGRAYQRTDLSLRNPRGMNLVCSHFEPIPAERVAERLPCVIYMHGNCSSRVEAIQALPVLLPQSITVFCLDFAGSGLSDGEYISLGFFERDDVAAAVEHLRKSCRVTCIGLWGRSMGAATALLHADRDPSIAGLVVDSPFSDLRVLCNELVETYTDGKIPHWLVGIALSMVRNSIHREAGFDINDLAPIEHVSSSFIPACFVAAEGDTFIKPHHARELHEAYAGDKNLVMVDGDHNTQRDRFFMDSVAIFFHNALMCDQLPQRGPPSQGVPDVSRSQERFKPKLESGRKVRLHGLRSAAELNGQTGELEQFIQETSRWRVKLSSGLSTDLKPENLQLQDEQARASVPPWVAPVRRRHPAEQEQHQRRQQAVGLEMRAPETRGRSAASSHSATGSGRAPWLDQSLSSTPRELREFRARQARAGELSQISSSAYLEQEEEEMFQRAITLSLQENGEARGCSL